MTEPGSVVGRMRPRDPSEPNRVSTSLELLFDLTFVVAVARAAAKLAQAIDVGTIGHGLLGYVSVFFAIWWAWMNFTWFASAYDVDDVPYRLLTLTQMAGVLVLAAGVPAAFDDQDFRAITLGYVVMRVAMILQWLRASAADEVRRNTALGYAGGIFVVQVGWVARLALPDSLTPWAFALLVLAELSVPLVTERQGMTPWHPHHVAERYGLFTIIVLGESVTASSNAVSGVFQREGLSADVIMLAGGGLVLLFGMWWLYFNHETGQALEENRHLSFVWGYSHVFVAASVAAVGASLEAASGFGAHSDRQSGRAVVLSVGVSVSVFLVVSAYLHGRFSEEYLDRVFPAASAAAIILVIGWLVGDASVPRAVMLQSLVVATLVVFVVNKNRRSS